MRQRIFLSVLSLAIVLTGTVAQAETEADLLHDHINLELGAGYRWWGTTGSTRAEEYENQRDSWTGGGSGVLIYGSHRAFLDGAMRNNEDYFGDATYGFRDLVLLRYVGSVGYHNLDNITLWDPDVSNGSSVDVRDAGNPYGLQFSISRMFARLKTPNFPFHLYASGDLIQKDGKVQQRSIQGSASFNDRVRTTQQRRIDWETKSYTVGANSHLGPIEVDVSYGEKRFDPSDDVVLVDAYTEATAGTTLVRSSGIYPHNLVPESKGSSATLKVHTTHTGKFVAAGTVSVKDRDNETSGAHADVFVGSGGITWLPTTKIAFFVKYFHRDLDADNPGSVTIADVSDPSNTYGNDAVRKTMSTKTDTVSVMGRFNLIPKTAIRVGYVYRDRRRDDSAAWYLPDSTHQHTATVALDTRLVNTLNAKLEYKYRAVSDPAYNNEPDNANEGRATLTWIPFTRVVAMGQYWISKENRDQLRFVDTGGAFDIPGDRTVTRDHILGTVTVLLLDSLTVTGTYAYLHNNTEQDIVYHSDVAPFDRMVDDNVPYKTTAFYYGVNLRFAVSEKLTVGGGVNYTLTRGLFLPGEADLREPVDVSAMSRLKVRETMYALSAQYELVKGLRLLVDYRYTGFNDVQENPFDDVSDSTAQIFWVGFSKKFG